MSEAFERWRGGFGQDPLESNVLPLIVGIISFVCLFLTWLTSDVTTGPIQATFDYSGWDLLDTGQAQRSYPIIACLFGLISAILAFVGIVSRKNVMIGLVITQFITFFVSLLFIILAPSYSHYYAVVEVEQSTSASFAPYVVMVATLVSFLYTLVPIIVFYLYPRLADSDARMSNSDWVDKLRGVEETDNLDGVEENQIAVTFHYISQRQPILLCVDGTNQKVLQPGDSCSFGVDRNLMHTFTVQYMWEGEDVVRESKLESIITMPCTFEAKLDLFGAAINVI